MTIGGLFAMIVLENRLYRIMNFEVPPDLKKLYKHWEKHSQKRSNLVAANNPKIDRIVEFVNERMLIWHKKTNSHQPPLTEDSILRDFRFCNIYRELDKQTILIHQSLKNLEDNFPLWLLNVAFNRFLCNHTTFEKVGMLNFNEKDNLEVGVKLTQLPSPKYGSAYIFPISIIQKSEHNTREKFLSEYLPTRISDVAKLIQTFKNIGVKEALDRILSVFGHNFRFHWTEILIDVAYQFPNYIDLFKKFPIGPGSLPTMKMLSDELYPEDVALNLANSSFNNINYLKFGGSPVLLSAENWEGIGCEYRKYQNLKKGTGRKRRYNSNK